MNTCTCDYESWSNIYFTNLFTTLGQLSAVLLSGSVAVPMVSYYSKSLIKFFSKQQSSNMSVGVKAYVKNEGEEWKKAFKNN